jgi:3-methyladenine DNA glycosylase/8-oxoguanine DNA glycosylase
MRMLRVPWVWDIAAGAILQQRVRFVDATRAWRRIVARHGTTSALGPAFPSARQLSRLTVAHVEACGVDAKRARTLIGFAREQALREVVHVDRELAVLRARLPSFPGIGPWTTAMILGFGYGDPDAILVGDVELPRRVCWTLARDPHGTDDKMLALLAPFAGHRLRVARLILSANDPPPRTYDGIR